MLQCFVHNLPEASTALEDCEDVSTKTENQEAREAAWRERQRVAAAYSANHVTTREMDYIFPEERPFTLENTEDNPTS